MESLFLTRDQALISLISWSTDSKTLYYQRTNPKVYQIVRTHTKETTWIQDLASHPAASSTLCRMPHLNNKQKKNTNPSSADRIITSLSSAHQRKNKTKLKKKLAQISPYFEAYTNPFVKLAQTTGPTLGGQTPKGKKNSTLRSGKRRPQIQ